jgi:hypothetical protein
VHGIIGLEVCHPILLNPEIVKQCGFKYIEEVGGFSDKYHVMFEIHYGGENWWEFRPFHNSHGKMGISIEALHELQNTYFLFEGKALQVFLPSKTL